MYAYTKYELYSKSFTEDRYFHFSCFCMSAVQQIHSDHNSFYSKFGLTEKIIGTKKISSASDRINLYARC